MILDSIKKILNNKYFIFIAISSIIIALLIIQLLNKQIKNEIIKWIQYPLILIPIILVIVFVSNFNICLAIIMLIAILILLLPDNNKYSYKTSLLLNEGFENKYEKELQNKEENDQYYIDGIKNLVSSKLKNIEKHHNNELSKGILENKKKILDIEKLKNKKDKSKTSSSDSNSSKIIEKRVFNPNQEDDTNLLLTKEILLDMVNRIEYNYENTNYLRKYIKSRVEEIIDTNNLLDEDL
jgi:hypothetical protein